MRNKMGSCGLDLSGSG